jgi:hypothetical protein
MKEQLVALLKSHAQEISQLNKSIARYPGAQIQKSDIKASAHAIAQKWFDEIKSALTNAQAPADSIQFFSLQFEQLMQVARTRASKKTYLGIVATIAHRYQKELIHEAEIGSFKIGSALSIAPYIDGLSANEGDYLDEAQRCLSVSALKGCIVLGWCATIARIHDKIESIGYDKFSTATEEMSAKAFGRYKFFKKKEKIETRSELQQVFDTNLLWVLEYLELIDNNEHQRLRHCFDLRNNCAHPGQAPIAPENVYAFYSDITKIVLKNSKFAVGSSNTSV